MTRKGGRKPADLPFWTEIPDTAGRYGRPPFVFKHNERYILLARTAVGSVIGPSPVEQREAPATAFIGSKGHWVTMPEDIGRGVIELDRLALDIFSKMQTQGATTQYERDTAHYLKHVLDHWAFKVWKAIETEKLMPTLEKPAPFFAKNCVDTHLSNALENLKNKRPFHNNAIRRTRAGGVRKAEEPEEFNAVLKKKLDFISAHCIPLGITKEMLEGLETGQPVGGDIMREHLAWRGRVDMLIELIDDIGVHIDTRDSPRSDEEELPARRTRAIPRRKASTIPESAATKAASIEPMDTGAESAGAGSEYETSSKPRMRGKSRPAKPEKTQPDAEGSKSTVPKIFSVPASEAASKDPIGWLQMTWALGVTNIETNHKNWVEDITIIWKLKDQVGQLPELPRLKKNIGNILDGMKPKTALTDEVVEIYNGLKQEDPSLPDIKVFERYWSEGVDGWLKAVRRWKNPRPRGK